MHCRKGFRNVNNSVKNTTWYKTKKLGLVKNQLPKLLEVKNNNSLTFWPIVDEKYISVNVAVYC